MGFSATIASKRKLNAYLLLNTTKLMYQCFKILPFLPNIMPSSVESPGRLSVRNFYVKCHAVPLLFWPYPVWPSKLESFLALYWTLKHKPSWGHSKTWNSNVIPIYGSRYLQGSQTQENIWDSLVICSYVYCPLTSITWNLITMLLKYCGIYLS